MCANWENSRNRLVWIRGFAIVHKTFENLYNYSSSFFITSVVDSFLHNNKNYKLIKLFCISVIILSLL